MPCPVPRAENLGPPADHPRNPVPGLRIVGQQGVDVTRVAVAVAVQASAGGFSPATVTTTRGGISSTPVRPADRSERRG